MSTAAMSKSKKTVSSKKPLSHPPFAEMITDAIVSLKERTGSSQYAITKFIEEKHKELPPTFRKLLLNRLKKLVAAGKLIKVKNSYKLAPTKLAPVKAATTAATKKPKADAKPIAKAKTKTNPKATVNRKAAVETKAVAKTKAKAKPAVASAKLTAEKKVAAKPAKKVAAKPEKKVAAKPEKKVAAKPEKKAPVTDVNKPKSVKSPAKK